MSNTNLLDQTRHQLESLSPERLRVAADFLGYLESRESEEATAELLAVPGLLDDLRRAEEDFAAGRMTPVEELRRKN